MVVPPRSLAVPLQVPPGLNPIPLVLLVGLVVLVLPVFVAASTLGTGESLVERRFGVSGPLFWLAVVAGLAAPLAFATVGATPANLDPAVAPTGALVAGLGLAVGAGNRAARRLRLTRAEASSTGDAAGGRVAATGTVACDDPRESPVFERPAVAWQWRVEVRNRDGVETRRGPGWEPLDTGVGGVPFAVDDGSGPLRVDPDAVRLDLRDERREERAPDADPPGRVATVATLDTAGDRFRFVESVLPPGADVTAVGRVHGGPDGPTLGGASALVVAGDRSVVARRYAVEAGVAGVLALGLTVWGLDALAALFGVPLPGLF